MENASGIRRVVVFWHIFMYCRQNMSGVKSDRLFPCSGKWSRSAACPRRHVPPASAGTDGMWYYLLRTAHSGAGNHPLVLYFRIGGERLAGRGGVMNVYIRGRGRVPLTPPPGSRLILIRQWCAAGGCCAERVRGGFDVTLTENYLFRLWLCRSWCGKKILFSCRWTFFDYTICKSPLKHISVKVDDCLYTFDYIFIDK